MKLITTILMIFFLIISFSLFSQRHYITDKHSLNLDDSSCCTNKKKNNFIIGDTLYVFGENKSHRDAFLFFYYSPLLDSLAISLNKNSDIALLIKAYGELFSTDPRYRERFTKEAKENTIGKANAVKDYLIEKGVKNCMLTFGMGATIWNKKGPKNDSDAQCNDLVQIFLVKSNLNLCYSLKPDVSFILKNVYFKVNKSDILPKSYNELNMLSDYLIANPSKAIEISGHTDSTGNEEKNLNLSQKRVEFIKDYLLKKGVKNKILAKGYGSSKPIASNNTEEGKAKNRRVEVKIIK